MEEISGEDKRVKERDMGELPATARKVTSTGLRCKTLKLLAEKKRSWGQEESRRRLPVSEAGQGKGDTVE